MLVRSLEEIPRLPALMQNEGPFDPNGLSVGGRLSSVENGTLVVWVHFALSNPTGGTSTLLPQGLYTQIGKQTSSTKAGSAMLIYDRRINQGLLELENLTMVLQ
jgi:hypothetical protein